MSDPTTLTELIRDANREITPADRHAILDLIEASNARIAQFERILDGLPQDAIDGGWTARGISAYAKQLEADLAFQKQVTDAARQNQAELLERAEMAEARIAALEARIAAAEKQEPVAWKIDGLNEYNESAPGVWLKKGNADASASMLFRSTVTPLYAHPLPSDAEGWRKDAVLPPLPTCFTWSDSHARRLWDESQMQEYARAALAKQQDQS